MTPRLTRRVLMQGALALPAGAAAPAAKPGPRVVSLDWGLTMTLLGLGIVPAGVAEKRSYADWVGEPRIPAGTAEVGLRTSPGLETLAALRPDLILVNALNMQRLGDLERIAPTFMSGIFDEERRPLARARDTAHRLGARLDRAAEAAALVEGAETALRQARERLAGRPARPVLPLNVVDARHLTVFGAGSLYQDVIIALGLPTAPVGPTSLWGHRVIGIADIVALLPADLLVIAPLPPQGRRIFDEPGLWRDLLAAGGGRPFILAPAWAYGDFTGAARFATQVAAALTTTAPA